jgi:iron-sulfur cluster assembly protein
MQTTTSNPISFTESAVLELKKLIAEKGYDQSQALRIGVKGGGCSGLSYVLGFDEKKEGDEEYVIDGVHCIIHKTHEMYLYGMQIDWQNGLNNRGFSFQNPNASKTCGCGTSFAV